MDIVLELFDTYIADYCYAKALPASGTSFLTETVKAVASSTFSSLREGATAAPAFSYQPSTSFFTLEPSQYAYQSAWPRDSVYRQALSLYLITWSVQPYTTYVRVVLTDSRLFGLLIYFVCSSASYFFIFDHATFTHPKYLKTKCALKSHRP